MYVILVYLLLISVGCIRCYKENITFTPAQDLLYLGDSALLELPGFTPGPALCNIAPFPVLGIQYAVSGLNMVCGGRGAAGSLLSSCFSLHGAFWYQEDSDMITARSGAAASYGPGGFLVTGGFGSEGYLASSEVFRDDSWQVGPSLPTAMEGHCQVQMEEEIFIVGKKKKLQIYLERYWNIR